jgi:protocatechuate 3,4-dioxygenase, beta subunit
MAGDSQDLERPARIWRRRLMLKRGAAFATALFVVPGAFADELVKTPKQTEGPFYPDRLPLDTDNDLIVINENTKPSVGDVTHLTGRILSPTGEPVRNALVEIWQCDANGAYLHSGTGNGEKRDSHFQGFGRFLTNSKGEYYFRTIKPVPYPGRTPHIHYKVKKGGKELLVTQCYIKGHPQNERDGVLRGIRDLKAKAALMVDWKKIEGSKIGEFAANFDIVLGRTPEA